jgi:hypothetical protein
VCIKTDSSARRQTQPCHFTLRWRIRCLAVVSGQYTQTRYALCHSAAWRDPPTTIMPLHALAGTATRRGASSQTHQLDFNNHASGIPFTLAVEPLPRRGASSPGLSMPDEPHHQPPSALSMSGHFIGQLRRSLPVHTPPARAHPRIHPRIHTTAARSSDADPAALRSTHTSGKQSDHQNKASRTGSRTGSPRSTGSLATGLNGASASGQYGQSQSLNARSIRDQYPYLFTASPTYTFTGTSTTTVLEGLSSTPELLSAVARSSQALPHAATQSAAAAVRTLSAAHTPSHSAAHIPSHNAAQVARRLFSLSSAPVLPHSVSHTAVEWERHSNVQTQSRVNVQHLEPHAHNSLSRNVSHNIVL